MVASRGTSGKVFCEGSPSWSPAAYIADRDLHARAADLLATSSDLRGATTISFLLPARDTYVYHAHLSVTLAQIQHAVSLGAANHLHAWYRDPDTPSDPAPPPPRADVDAYLSIFDPSTATSNALKALASNAKKLSLRARVATNLTSKRFLHPALLPKLTIPKRKPAAAPVNPYFTFLSWACRELEWCGPSDLSEGAPVTSHPVLPLLMHHFGCVCPTFEALEMLKVLAAGREIIDMGSGSGYWTFMLRLHGVAACTPVDNAQSSWRVMWVDDTQVADGVKFISSSSSSQKRAAGAADAVLLLVYPIVGGGVAGGEEGGFTRSLVKAYKGDTLVVVGTQNRNGYTGFRGQSMDEYMAREHGGEWTKVAQVPLLSFPGKDEAMFVFQRGERAPLPVVVREEEGETRVGAST